MVELNLINISMILSTKHKFIFWHIPKTAGTSVRERLETLGGDPDQLFKRQWITPGVTPRFWMHANQDDFKEDLSTLGLQVSHYREITFVRNPYHRAVSLYNYSKYRIKFDRTGRPQAGSPNYTFDEYIDSEMNKTPLLTLKQVHWTKNPLTTAGVKVFKLEGLPSAWQELQDYIGVKLLPLEKLNVTAENIPHQLLTVNDLTQHQRNWIYNYFREDFEAFGYER
jgi:hypothetical protein